jgi:hypothetical protein
MDEEVERRIEYLHMALGLIAGVISGVVTNNGFIYGLMVGYSGFFIIRLFFNVEKEDNLIHLWLSKGAIPFLMFWLPVWIFVFNL